MDDLKQESITQSDLARALNVTSACIQIRAKKLGILSQRLFVKGGMINVYTMDQAKLLGYTPEAPTKNEHPLVTDPRWLKFNEWPETTPACFQDF